jgi:hypothetical protein
MNGKSEATLTFEHIFKLTTIDTTQGKCYRPLLTIRISYGEQAIDVDAMVDTGADFSTFNKGVAKSLHIPDDQLILDDGTTLEGRTPMWYCPITITLLGHSYQCRAAFIDNPDWHPVIGRDTLFSRAQFAFRQSINRFYVSNKP